MAKFYLEEPDAPAIRAVMRRAQSLSTSAWPEAGFWTLVPVTTSVLTRMQTSVEALPADVFLRAGDAIHLASAVEIGEREVWSSDRHLLAATPHFGLTGRSA